ncbi:ABC transporter substrate-binding protein [Virgibacillus pantothenticus]|uniref:Sugar ABC transporter substrate-binding protein n=2 Tax=Bacillaceae TaxID=186817 RepID=A0A0L0QQR3_VIRPA|nr:ABC transporter substrate-binding protein [Virgibacillus pantothenticus]API94330.1 sugar ABC transporter substrate-binding protein [Virgibacillus sp. 6R]MBS7430230.1 ABC transporter substrate-binding protein [Virgibacillus sp. 19R1-5]KNE20937.1 sugar ABC transporter substrate-binding protein [Virgibacillus pantothenticus]MBU8566214.1 ABC transporter substrate-binding protein [Virgibacillus pantothenticus]MBU8602888.1 ABC transporter substrate-binding protein [Virgibacillus pantothenticus]
MRKKAKLISLLFIIAFVLIVSACGKEETKEDGNKQNDDSKEEITLEFWTMQLKPTFTDYIEGVIADFEKENPNIKIDWLDVPAADLDKKILSAVSTDSAPDVVNLNPTFASQLAQLDALVNMEEAVADEDKDKYVKGAWEANRIKDITFAIPWYLSTEVTLNNKQIFEEAGLDIKNPPSTFEEAREASEIIKEKTGKYGYFPSLDLSLVLQHMVVNGAELTNEDGTKAAFNSKEGLEMFEYFTELYKEELIPKEALTGDQRETIDMYQAGQVAFFAGSQFISQIKENAPDIYKNTVPSEAITGNSGKKTMSVQNVVVPKQTKHEKAAVQFALFLTNAENQLEFSKLTPILPSSLEALEDPYFTEAPEGAEASDLVRITSAAQLEDAELLVPPMENYDELRQSMYDAISESMLGKLSPQEALDKAEQEWNEILSK